LEKDLKISQKIAENEGGLWSTETWSKTFIWVVVFAVGV